MSLLTEIKTAGHGQWNHQFLRRTVPVHCTPYSYSYTAHKSVTFSRFKRALNCNQHQLFMIVSCGQAAFSLHGYLTSLLVGSMQKCVLHGHVKCVLHGHMRHISFWIVKGLVQNLVSAVPVLWEDNQTSNHADSFPPP